MTINPKDYINREISWLEFNQRVLDQACDPGIALLERLKFLAITASNLDEFFMVRIGGLQLQQGAGVSSTDPAGMTVSEQLTAVYERTERMVKDQYTCLLEQIEPALEQSRIFRIRLADAAVRHQEAAARIFEEQIFPVLSPMVIDQDSQFPLLANRALYVCAQIETTSEEDPFRFVLIPLGKVLPRFITLPAEQGYSYLLLEEIVSNFISSYFPGEKIVSSAVFRISRNADVSIQEDSAADLLHGMKELLQQRKTAECVRLEIDHNASAEVILFLQRCLNIGDRETWKCPQPLDLSAFMKLSGLEGFNQLRNVAWVPQKSPQVDPTQSIFTNLADQDILLCHPYESFEPVIRLVEEAADDPDVLAIKQTLYRTSPDSRIVAALRRAAERGKYVTAIVELKARFDEAQNIEWAQELEEAQVQVIYGVKNLKTHAKACVVVRREPRGIVRYMHFGTGNYNESTARFYSDISYMTCNDELGADVSAFFNAVTGYSQPQPYQVIEAAPVGLRRKLLELIDAEIQRKKQGQKAAITAKFNSLVDPQLIEALYRASQAGVNVRLNIRGICCLRPGVKGLSDNITVISIVDRILEHARILHFRHSDDDLMYISSADWMPRNLDRRIELLVPVLDPTCKKRLLSILEDYFRDRTNCWQLQSDGTYQRRGPKKDGRTFRAQEALNLAACSAIAEEERKRQAMFEPHQPAARSES